MNVVKILGIVLIIAGILALVYGRFRYTRKTRRARFGSVELSSKNKRTVNVPVWAGVSVVIVGVALLLLPS